MLLTFIRELPGWKLGQDIAILSILVISLGAPQLLG
jgi:hypothetical protein